MKKSTIIILFFLLAHSFSYSQFCLSDQYLEMYKRKDPQLSEKIKETIKGFGNERLQKNLVNDYQIITIPVVFNIIHDGENIGEGKNLSLTRLEEQIDHLNNAFSGQYGGVDTKIRFCMAKKDSYGNETTNVNRYLVGTPYYDMGTTVGGQCVDNWVNDGAIKIHSNLSFPSTLYLNIWTTDLRSCGSEGLAGYSSFPYPGDEILDGVVLDYMYVGNNSTTNSIGSTAVHEVGHWLGLYHIFQGGCSESSCDTGGDMICDTQTVPQEGFYNDAPGECMGYNCNNEPTDVVQNFMDYQDENCYKSFTNGQKERMRDNLHHYRGIIYTQNTPSGSVVACSTGDTGSNQDNDQCYNHDFPIKKIYHPFSYQNNIVSNRYAERFEVDDKWLVFSCWTRDYGSTNQNQNYLCIYKREGCYYILHQTIPFPLSFSKDEHGITLNNDEIVLTDYNTDSVYILRHDTSNNLWSLSQEIVNATDAAEVGSSAFVLDRFLFVLEKKSSFNAFRIYYKNLTGNYVYHQTLTGSGLGVHLPSEAKKMQAANFLKQVINFSSSTFTGSYDPQEILICTAPQSGPESLMIMRLMSNNNWTFATTPIVPQGFPTGEIIFDIDISKNYIYLLTGDQTGYKYSPKDLLNIYSYTITANSLDQFISSYSKQSVIYDFNSDAVGSDHQFKIIDDQFMLIDDVKNHPVQVLLNVNHNSASIPFWQHKGGVICPSDLGNSNDDFHLLGNLLFVGLNKSGISVINMYDYLTEINYDQNFIGNSIFHSRNICVVPEEYSTIAEEIGIGGQCVVNLSKVSKNFIAKSMIVLKPGASITAGSNVSCKIGVNTACFDVFSTSNVFTNFSFSTDEDNYEETLSNDILVYPNPTLGLVTIKNLTNDEIKRIEIYTVNIMKVLIYDKNISIGESIDIDLISLQIGVYFVKVILKNGESVYKKLIKN